jgi:transposase
MSTSSLYHGFGIRGYRYVKTACEAGQVMFTIRQERGDLRCAICGSRRVVRRGFQSRCFRSLPIGARPVQTLLEVPRVGGADCGEVRQVPVDFADERRTCTHALERYVLELSPPMTIRDEAKRLHETRYELVG